MTMNFKSNDPKVLLAEGDNDCHVIAALCGKYGLPKNFGLNKCGSDDLVLTKLEALLYTDDIQTIGVVLDADNPDLLSKWRRFQAVLHKANIKCPEKPDKDGTMISANENHPRIGLWLMPDNKIDGMLEDFCLTLAKPEAINFAENCVSKAKEQNHTSFIDAHQSKAVVHTYLAWQDEPGKPLGQAITANILNSDNLLAKTFADWLKSLFDTKN